MTTIVKAELCHEVETNKPIFFIEWQGPGLIDYDPFALLWEAQCLHKDGEKDLALVFLGYAEALLPELKDNFRFILQYRWVRDIVNGEYPPSDPGKMGS